MGHQKEIKIHQVCTRLNDLQYKAVMALGGPTEIIEKYIEAHAGDVIKTKIAKQRILDNINMEQARVESFDALLKAYEEKAAEERRHKQEAKAKTPSKPPQQKDKLKKLEECRVRWKGYLDGGVWDELSENNYNYIMEATSLKTKDEVDLWLKNGTVQTELKGEST